MNHNTPIEQAAADKPSGKKKGLKPECNWEQNHSSTVSKETFSSAGQFPNRAKPLFRHEALNHTKNNYYGSVGIGQAFPYSGFIPAFSILMLLFIIFVLIAEFSEKYTVKGYLDSSKGIARIYPIQEGIINKCKITQGDHVKKGDVLLVVNTTYDSLATKAVKHNELLQLMQIKTKIQHNIQQKKEHLEVLKPLLIKKYIAASVYQSTYDEISALDNNLHQINIQLIKYKQSRHYAIRAPISGTITNVINQVGQYVQPTRPVLNMLPDNAQLIAQLYIPVSKAGYINPHDPIMLHYDAYPYQRNGAAKATIQTISQTLLTDDDEIKPIRIGEPYYKAIAKLDKQTILLQGKTHRLQFGMTCSAIVSGARKKIWQWLLDPLRRIH